MANFVVFGSRDSAGLVSRQVLGWGPMAVWASPSPSQRSGASGLIGDGGCRLLGVRNYIWTLVVVVSHDDGEQRREH